MLVNSIVIFLVIIKFSTQQDLSSLLKNFGCPKQWTHLGGSCYYLSNTTCHSTRAHLIQIDNAVELFYAASVLKQSNLSAIMIEINQNSTKISKRMKNLFLEHRLKYYELKEQIFEQFELAGIRLGGLSRDIQKSIQKQYPEVMYGDPIDWDTYEVHRHNNLTSWLFPKNTNDNLNFLNNYQKLCHEIKWNITKTESKIFILSSQTSPPSNKTICWLNNIDIEKKYPHLCEYVMDHCFANNICGRNGRCMNTGSGYKCYCSYLYEGPHCEKISKQGKQIIIGGSIMIGLYVFAYIVCVVMKLWNKLKIKPSKFIQQLKFNKHDCARICCVLILTIVFCVVSTSFLVTTYLKSFKTNLLDKAAFDQLMEKTSQLIAKRGTLTDCRLENLIFCPFALILIVIFSFLPRKNDVCTHNWECQPSLLSPFQPFRRSNRFTTAAVFGIIAYKLLKITEELLFSATNPLSRGAFYELIDKIGLIFLIGLRYYPVLAALQFRNFIIRSLTCMYLFADLLYTIIREQSCISFLPLSKYHASFEEAKLQNKMSNWFITFGLIKNIPHFLLLSYLLAELCIRATYDTVKDKQNQHESNESISAKNYVTILFRRLQDEKYQYSHIPTVIVCAFTVASIFVYYLSCTLIFIYIIRSTSHASFITHTIERIFFLEYQGFLPLRPTILISGITTVIIYVLHLWFTLRNYQIHRNQLFQKPYPHKIQLTGQSSVAKSLRYFGYLTGYMTCGFLVWFHLIVFLLLSMKVIALKIPFIESLFATILPIFIIYMSINAIIWFAAQNSLVQQHPALYAVLLYIFFLFDCLLGIVTCFLRLIGRIFLDILFMARFDTMNNLDSNLNVYQAYLHMDAENTNPIMFTFCHLVYEDICKRRPNTQCNLCCLESDSPPTTPEIREMHIPVRRQALAKFRWFWAYTLINNLNLLDQTKRKMNTAKLFRHLLCVDSDSFDRMSISSEGSPVVEAENGEREMNESQLRYTSNTERNYFESASAPLLEHNN